MMPLEDATPQRGRVLVLRELLQRDGYLLLRGLVPTEIVERARRAVAGVLVAGGWLDDPTGADLTVHQEAIASTAEERDAMFCRAFRLEAVHALGHMSALVELMAGLLEAPILVHPRPFVRLVLPTAPGQLDTTTAAHQDFVSQQGSLDTLTAWTPLHEVSLERGALALAAQSHLRGVLPFRLGQQIGSMEVAAPLADSWRASLMRAGDVVIFHSLTAHKALPNVTSSLRLSLDFRYQRASEPVNAQCLQLGGLPYEWEDVYADWQGQAPRHYWRQLPLVYRPFDPTYHRQRDELALEMAENGDARALAELRRLTRSTSHPLFERAAALLARFDQQASHVCSSHVSSEHVGSER